MKEKDRFKDKGNRGWRISKKKKKKEKRVLKRDKRLKEVQEREKRFWLVGCLGFMAYQPL